MPEYKTLNVVIMKQQRPINSSILIYSVVVFKLNAKKILSP